MSNIKLNKIFKTACIASDHAGFGLKEDIKNHLTSGGAKSMEEYASMVGEYRCLNKIHEDILDIEKRYIND